MTFSITFQKSPQYERLSRHWGNLATLYGGMKRADHETVCLWLKRDEQGVWNVACCNDNLHELHAYLLEYRLLFNAGGFKNFALPVWRITLPAPLPMEFVRGH